MVTGLAHTDSEKNAIVTGAFLRSPSPLKNVRKKARVLRANFAILLFNINDLAGGWGARDRTWEWRYQKPLPYRLATPQRQTRMRDTSI